MATTSFQPRVSVLVPTFDQAHFIARALASLQAQTLDAWEAVGMDDGSCDASAAAVACRRWRAGSAWGCSMTASTTRAAQLRDGPRVGVLRMQRAVLLRIRTCRNLWPSSGT
ncbi:glycosyltransferase family 2 protein [Massilia cellulosiltytica]|uniref:glycosyltransferase family 2 protein n=1 Tax=Massilia cellulosiltytica TaxID=2683234 RepID=UPI0039B4BA33